MKRLVWALGAATALSFASGCAKQNTVDNGPISTMSETEALAARTSCTFTAGDQSGKTFAKGTPLGDDIPIDHIVVLMLENRSFDHLLQNLPALGVTDAEVAPAGFANPDEDGNSVPAFRLDEYCFDDTNHEWNGAHRQYNGGTNDGFVVSNRGGDFDALGTRGMGYYTEQDVPIFYALAKEYAVADRFFCSLLGPTFPNRSFFYGATSFGHTANQLITDQVDNLAESLERAKVDWRVYYQDIPGMGVFLASTANFISNRFLNYSTFRADAMAGKLPSVTFVDPMLGPAMKSQRNDGHPPGNIQTMDGFVREVVETVTASPNWNSTALFIMFDEHGGSFDHVAPPMACAPDANAPTDTDTYEGFQRLGFRVPLIVVSPYAKRNYVSHATLEHTSVTRFIEARFGLPALTKRDANATMPLDMFDFKKKNTKAATLPAATLDPTKNAQCIERFGE